MPAVSDKVMFEVYRENSYDRRYRVVYFTELDEHNKAAEINQALAGDHVYDGFLAGTRLAEAKRILNGWVHRWNQGEPVNPVDFEAAMAGYFPDDTVIAAGPDGSGG